MSPISFFVCLFSFSASFLPLLVLGDTVNDNRHFVLGDALVDGVIDKRHFRSKFPLKSSDDLAVPHLTPKVTPSSSVEDIEDGFHPVLNGPIAAAATPQNTEVDHNINDNNNNNNAVVNNALQSSRRSKFRRRNRNRKKNFLTRKKTAKLKKYSKHYNNDEKKGNSFGGFNVQKNGNEIESNAIEQPTINGQGGEEEDYWIASTTLDGNGGSGSESGSGSGSDSGKASDLAVMTGVHTSGVEGTTLQTALEGGILDLNNGRKLRGSSRRREHNLIMRVRNLVTGDCIRLGAFKLECDYLFSHILNMMKRGKTVYAFRDQDYSTSDDRFNRDAIKCLDATVTAQLLRAQVGGGGSGGGGGGVHSGVSGGGGGGGGGAFEFYSCLSKKITREANRLTKLETLLAEIKVEFENMCSGLLETYCNDHFATIVEDPVKRLHRYYGIRISQLRFWSQSIFRDCRSKPQFPHCFFQRMLLYEKQTIEKTKHILVYKAAKKRKKAKSRQKSNDHSSALFTVP